VAQPEAKKGKGLILSAGQKKFLMKPGEGGPEWRNLLPSALQKRQLEGGWKESSGGIAQLWVKISVPNKIAKKLGDDEQ